MKRFAKTLAYIFFGLLALTLVTSGAFGAWVYYKPRSLNAYIPQIEAEASKALSTHKVKIAKANLAWGGLQDFVFIKLENIKITNSNNKADAVAKEIDLNLDFLKLLSGQMGISSITIKGASADLTPFLNTKKTSSKELPIQNFEIYSSRLFVPQFAEVWQVNKAQIHHSILKTRIATDISIGNKEKIIAKAIFNKKLGFYRFNTNFRNFDTSRLKYIGWADINFVGTGSIKGKIERNKIDDLHVNIQALKGSISNPRLVRGKLQVTKAFINASYNGDIIAKDTHIDFADGFSLSANGNSSRGLELAFKNMQVDNLYKYWPYKLGENAIAWIKPHISKGVLSSGKAIIHGKKLDFKFNYSGLHLDYLKPLMPVTNITGTAHMNEHSLNIDINSAVLGTSKLSNTNVLITEIGGELEKIAINGIVSGSVKDLADFYIKVNKRRGKSTMFASTADVAGGAVSKVSLHFPLLAALKFDEVGIKINSSISNASAAKIANNMNLSLNLNDHGYNIIGKGNINYLSDSLKITNAPATYKVDVKNNISNIILNADLTASELSIPALGAQKTAGDAASLALNIKNNNIQNLAVNAKTFKLNATGQLGADHSIKSLNITNFESNKTKLSGTVNNANGLEANINAAVLNAAPIIEYAHNKKASDDDSRVKVKITANQALFKYDIKSNNVSLESDCAKTCTLFKFASPDITIFKSPTVITVAAKNAGKALRMLDAYEFMKDGSLAVNAKATTPENYVGTLRINDFYIIKGKVLTKILTLGSLTGIADTLQGNGIYFKKLKGDFKKNGDVITLENFTMYGSAIGITAEGTIDLKTNQVKIKGSIIPSYTANTLLGKIPVLGAIVGGDEGMFAFTYSLKGNLDDPQISVNPLSVLAPGFLKGIFQ